MKARTIRTSMFFTYAIILIISCIIYYSLFIVFEVQNVSKQTLATISQYADTIGDSIDDQLEDLNMVTMNVSYSNIVKSTFAQYNGSDNLAESEYFNNTKMLGDLLIAIIGPNFPADQINLYSLDNGVFASGISNGYYANETRDMPWYNEVMDASGLKIIKFTGEDPRLSRYFNGEYKKSFVSLFRVYYNIFNNPQGIVEAKKTAYSVFGSAITHKSIYGEKIYVFDSTGNLVYPISDTDQSFYFQEARKILADEASSRSVKSPNGTEVLACSSSDFSGFTTVVALPESSLFSNAWVYFRNTAILTCLMIIFCMVVAYFAARHITAPIDLIYKQVASFRLDRDHRKANIHTNIYELNSLNEGFFDMQEKLRESIDQQMLLQTQEMQSKMLALQSQMNPHFLFNSISAIQSMAEDGMDDEIVVMCQSIASLLRYISADSEQLVPLNTELSYTENYLTCMIIRYQEDLSYSSEVPDEMREVKIPKLCIQLLVENAIKFSTTIKPPWHIKIKGFIQDGCSYISVIDNGPGFDPQTVRDIEDKIRQIDESGLLPSLEIKGMGLMNIYIRLKILNSTNFTFRLENLGNGGACITIGGWHEE